ncbi:MAG: PrsW family intramembrane metalloprotease [Anaerolineaceae bacterium]|nr:PrsW family intramembrane metalloprotease [Anaerolineaceae bacterium]
METTGILASILISFGSALFFAYLLHWFDRYEKEPFLLLAGVFLWGAVVAAGGAFIINTVLGLGVFVVTGSEVASDLVTTSLTAPFIEEILKGFTVLMVFFAFRDQFDSLLDGILYAGVAALGFAATENAYYIYAYGFAETGWQGFWELAQIRVLLVGWQHPFYTAFFGIGLAISRLNRSLFVKITAPILGLTAAILTHSVHNTLASLLPGTALIPLSTVLDWFGCAAMLIFILIAMALEKREIRTYLADEIALGTLTEAQYQNVISANRVNRERVKAFFTGKYSAVNRFYRTAARLAIKKKQQARLGDERGSAQKVDKLREETRQLSQTLAN